MKKEPGHFRQAQEVDRNAYNTSECNMRDLATKNTSELNRENSTLPKPTEVEGVLPPLGRDGTKNIEEDHKFYRRQEFFPEIDITHLFTKKERGLLLKYGSWMNALDDKDIKPYTEEQEKFLINIKDYVYADYLSDYEKVWIKYNVRLNAIKRKDGTMIGNPITQSREERIKCY